MPEMSLEDFEAMIQSVAETVSAPGYFPAIMPENDLHPDPRVLRDELLALRRRVELLEKSRAHAENLGDATHGHHARNYFRRR